LAVDVYADRSKIASHVRLEEVACPGAQWQTLGLQRSIDKRRRPGLRARPTAFALQVPCCMLSGLALGAFAAAVTLVLGP
jgi:hypothetical protein